MKRSASQALVLANGTILRNRLVMAPMTTWSANPDGTISDKELAYYRVRVNGVGLVITGCTHVSPDGVGFTGEFAAYDDKYIPSLRRLADAAKSGGAPAILQIFHAGNKAVPGLVPNGRIVSASALKASPGPFNDGELMSAALTHEEVLGLVAAFGEATRRAIEAGFDGVELHGAHGFLLQNFLSPMFNRRGDEWGGSLEGRMRFPLAVVATARRVIAERADRPFLLGYRISPEEAGEGGLRVSDALALTDRLIDADIDYLHVSLHDLLEGRSRDSNADLTTAAEFVNHVAGRVPVIAAGQVRTPEQAERAIAAGLDLVAVGKGLVMNPDWVEKALAGCDAQVDVVLRASKVPALDIPEGLQKAIGMTKGWFPVAEEA